MTGRQRREQLLTVAKVLFAEKGFEPTSVEEIAAQAGVSKPVVYEHFGGKQGVYAVVLDREVQALLSQLTSALESSGHPRVIVERAALALLDYIDNNADGFRILVRDSPVAQATGTFSSMLGDIAIQVEHLLADQFTERGFDAGLAVMYALLLVGRIAFTGQWWLEEQWPDKRTLAAHLANLAWYGLRDLKRTPQLVLTEDQA
jgi:AcrR family transcriptional regulator